MITSREHFLGIDVGSVYVHLMMLNRESHLIIRRDVPHCGNIREVLMEELGRIEFARISRFAFNKRAEDLFTAGLMVNEQVALIEGIRHFQKKVGSVFVIGGETFGLILFDRYNRYRKYIGNSSCAAGTGAFLDQQATRLGLSSGAELGELAETFHGDPPKIATRCAVFAKTDLIHCQQQGTPLEAIAAGLCKGLAHNIADTLLKGVHLRRPVTAVGGVSKIGKVIHYLSDIIGCPIQVPEYPEIITAAGCALLARNEGLNKGDERYRLDSLLVGTRSQKQYFFPPLRTDSTTYPDFTQHRHYLIKNVEVDLYQPLQKEKVLPVYLGIDIGSTSTKATVMSAREGGKNIILGLYTRTLGQPIKATQALLSVLAALEVEVGTTFEFWGVGTTGSGRKFIQRIISADLAIDEITAHARAAHCLHPQVDTIIEIGGQDAKFTVLKDGQVTFSVMNYVCAAGTGSFIEEQARRLQISLDEYSEKALHTPAPLTSDRCTVFMERDLNYLLGQGYSKKELLAAALHSVRDNYLTKVAHTGRIGKFVCFQGATAKNRALVAAFEQKLQKPIFVSRYCHLTGAMGVNLFLKEQQLSASKFRGIAFCREPVHVGEKICDDCKNHCKLNEIKIGNDTVLWGHLCGREEGERKRAKSRSGFDLLSSRRKIFTAHALQQQRNPKKQVSEKKKNDINAALARLKQLDPTHSLHKLKRLELDKLLEGVKETVGLNLLQLQHTYYAFTNEQIQPALSRSKITIGIPNALYVQEYVPFWSFFFRTLGYSVRISPQGREYLKKGTELSGAEFCAPISNWHGHVHFLSGRVDYLFLPHMLSDEPKNKDKFYCYYSNYAVSLVHNIESLRLQRRIISPLINFSESALENVRQIYDSLPPDLKLMHNPHELKEAFMRAWRWYASLKDELIALFLHQNHSLHDISVVLVGRPYIVFDAALNKHIPQKFNAQDIPTFFQDMLPAVEKLTSNVGREFLRWNHWRYANYILNAAEYSGQHRGLYPVFLTGFKCSPDSFVIDYFREIMDAYLKPYLVLQIDEHDSEVGYDTRIEAAVRTFRNDFQKNKPVKVIAQKVTLDRSFPKGGHVLIPNYDRLSCSLICAAFEKDGYRAHLIEESPTTILSSLRLNDGQCLPVSAIVQGAIETVQKYKLPAENTAIFLNALTKLSCNLPQYPLMALQLLKKEGRGFEKLHVFATNFELRGLSLDLIYNIYFAYLFGGLLRRFACKIRPYELHPGETDRVLEHSRRRLYHCLSHGESKEEQFSQITESFAEIPLQEIVHVRPKVGIMGDLYVRDNEVFNQRLIHELEELGAEVITTPFNYLVRMSAAKHHYMMSKEGRYLSLLRDKMLIEVLEKFEKRFYHIAAGILDEEFPTFENTILEPLKQYSISLRHSGETAQNIVKIYCMLHHYPDISLFIHVNPIFCCAGLVSESIFKRVEKEIGVPIVSIVYDGTMREKNDLLAPYLYYIRHSLSV